MNFKNWLLLSESRGRPGTKQGLYPPAYSGIYPPCDWLPYAADAITYSPSEWLDFKFLYTFDAPPLANRTKGVKYISIPCQLPRP